MCNTIAGTRVSTTDVVEDIAVSVFISAGLDGAAQGVEHALAEFPMDWSAVVCISMERVHGPVGTWRQRTGLGSPGSTNGWAGSNGVGRSVRGAVDTRRRDG